MSVPPLLHSLAALYPALAGYPHSTAALSGRGKAAANGICNITLQYCIMADPMKSMTYSSLLNVNISSCSYVPA